MTCSFSCSLLKQVRAQTFQDLVIFGVHSIRKAAFPRTLPQCDFCSATEHCGVWMHWSGNLGRNELWLFYDGHALRFWQKHITRHCWNSTCTRLHRPLRNEHMVRTPSKRNKEKRTHLKGSRMSENKHGREKESVNVCPSLVFSMAGQTSTDLGLFARSP